MAGQTGLYTRNKSPEVFTRRYTSSVHLTAEFQAKSGRDCLWRPEPTPILTGRQLAFMSSEYSGESVRVVYAGPGDGEAGALSKSGLAVYVDDEKVSGDVYRVTLRYDDPRPNQDITQHDFRDREGEDLVFDDASIKIGVGKATSKMVSVLYVNEFDSRTWG